MSVFTKALIYIKNLQKRRNAAIHIFCMTERVMLCICVCSFSLKIQVAVPRKAFQDPKTFESMKIKEIKNGRLAMIAFFGFIAQHAATGKTPLANLADHLDDPFHSNVSSNS